MSPIALVLQMVLHLSYVDSFVTVVISIHFPFLGKNPHATSSTRVVGGNARSFVFSARQLKAFKVRPFWEFECGPEAGRKALVEAEEALIKERKKLDTATHLCALFDFPDLIKESQRMIGDMESNCKLMYKVCDLNQLLPGTVFVMLECPATCETKNANARCTLKADLVALVYG